MQQFEETDGINHKDNLPIIGINDQFLDPYDVKNALNEEQLIEQENGIVEHKHSEQHKIEDIMEQLQVSLIPRHDPLVSNSVVPVVLQVATLKSQHRINRAPIDLVCVVDVSGSMIGRKISLVKNSLRYLMKMLGSDDRICIVIFTTVAHIITPWTRNTPENKEFLKQTILDIKGLSSTNIADGVNKGLWMLKNRKYKNPISCMFLLSDGHDDNTGADIRVQEHIKHYNIDEKIVIHTFGYGSDHDAPVMNTIASFMGGAFYYIDDINKASDYFVLAMSGMLSIYAQNINILLTTNQSCSINKVFGEGQIWHKVEDTYNITMNYLLQGENKDFVFELNVQDQPDGVFKPLEITIKGELVMDHTQFSKQFEFTLNVNNQQQGQLNAHVEINYLRAFAGAAIGSACLLSQKKKYEEAIAIIDPQIEKLSTSLFKDIPAIKIALDDLQKCKTYCKPKIFELEGEAFLMKKERNHLNRQSSLNNLNDWNEDQQENMAQLKNGEFELSACGSQVGSDSELCTESDLEDFDPKMILKELLKLHKYQQQQQYEQPEDDDNNNNEVVE